MVQRFLGAGFFLSAAALCPLGLSSALFAAKADIPVLTKPTDVAATVPLSADPIVLHLEDRKRTQVGKLVYMGGLHLKSSDNRFGGLSSLIVSEDGSQMLAVSDCGYWIGANLGYQGGRLTTVHNLTIAPMLDLKGRSMTGCSAKAEGDAEALTEIPGSGMIVSFEGDHRLWHYGATMSDFMVHKLPRPLPLPVDILRQIKALPFNTGIEAMTTIDGGNIVAIAEDTKRGDGVLPGWIIGDTRIAMFTYIVPDAFRPSDMTTLPDGDLLVLERRFTLLQGLGARIKRIAKGDVRSNQRIEGEHIATLTFPYNIDNMEGIAARKGPDGETLIYILSDDNYFPFQRTLLMMFRLDS